MLKKMNIPPILLCVEFPVQEPYFTKGKRDVVNVGTTRNCRPVSILLGRQLQCLSLVTFKEEEASQIKSALEMYETRLKAVSFLKYQKTGYTSKRPMSHHQERI